MAIKVGTDIIDINRVKKSIDRFGDKFLDRFLSKKEIAIAKKVETVAGFWASKEAISKALGCGIGKELSFLDIEIKKDYNNAPYFELKNQKWSITDLSLSISHDSNFAIAVVVIIL